MITPELLRIFSRYLNLCENDSGSPETDYRSIYLYRDGNGGRKQVTLGRGFTQDGGNLWKVLARYIEKGGAKASFFAPYKAKMGSADLWSDTAFLKAITSSAGEPAMQAAQDEVFREVYLGPALAWCDRNHFTAPLSNLVAVDSYLHSGQMSPKLVASFPERPPVSGGDERVWMFDYLVARWAWFTRVSGPLHTCVFRPKFFLDLIATHDDAGWHLRERGSHLGGGNWDLTGELVVPGKGRI